MEMNLFFRKNPSYIEIYDKVWNKQECSRLIELFEQSEKQPGVFGIGSSADMKVDVSVKKTIELKNLDLNNHTEISKIIKNKLTQTISKYYTKYFKSLNSIEPWILESNYNFQKYQSPHDGYKLWHTEHGCSSTSSKRILVWTFYLNDAKSGTEFVNYSTIKAKTGRCVIWPAGWTHTHKSEKNKGIKYIATGWVSYS